MQTFFSRGSVSIREPFSSKFFHRLIFAVHFFNYFKFCSCCCDFFLPPSCEFCDFFAYCTHTPPDPPRTERGLYKQNNTQKKRKSVLDCWRCVFCTVWVSESEKKKKKTKIKISDVNYFLFLIKTRRDDSEYADLHLVHDANCNISTDNRNCG